MAAENCTDSCIHKWAWHTSIMRTTFWISAVISFLVSAAIVFCLVLVVRRNRAARATPNIWSSPVVPVPSESETRSPENEEPSDGRVLLIILASGEAAEREAAETAGSALRSAAQHSRVRIVVVADRPVEGANVLARTKSISSVSDLPDGYTAKCQQSRLMVKSCDRVGLEGMRASAEREHNGERWIAHVMAPVRFAERWDASAIAHIHTIERLQSSSSGSAHVVLTAGAASETSQGTDIPGTFATVSGIRSDDGAPVLTHKPFKVSSPHSVVPQLAASHEWLFSRARRLGLVTRTAVNPTFPEPCYSLDAGHWRLTHALVSQGAELFTSTDAQVYGDTAGGSISGPHKFCAPASADVDMAAVRASVTGLSAGSVVFSLVRGGRIDPRAASGIIAPPEHAEAERRLKYGDAPGYTDMPPDLTSIPRLEM